MHKRTLPNDITIEHKNLKFPLIYISDETFEQQTNTPTVTNFRARYCHFPAQELRVIINIRKVLERICTLYRDYGLSVRGTACHDTAMTLTLESRNYVHCIV